MRVHLSLEYQDFNYAIIDCRCYSTDICHAIMTINQLSTFLCPLVGMYVSLSSLSLSILLLR